MHLCLLFKANYYVKQKQTKILFKTKQNTLTNTHTHSHMQTKINEKNKCIRLIFIPMHKHNNFLALLYLSAGIHSLYSYSLNTATNEGIPSTVGSTGRFGFVDIAHLPLTSSCCAI